MWNTSSKKRKKKRFGKRKSLNGPKLCSFIGTNPWDCCKLNHAMLFIAAKLVIFQSIHIACKYIQISANVESVNYSHNGTSV